MVLMEEGVYRMGGDTHQIKQSFKQMDDEMSEMNYEMNQISRPMRSFNDFFPFVPEGAGVMTEQESIAEVLFDAAKKFEQKTHDQEAFAHKVAHKTKRVIGVSIIFLTVFTIFTGFSIYSLSEVLEESVTHMETMYNNFGAVAGEMNSMTDAVTSMEQNVSNITNIAGLVSSMRKSVEGMEKDMLLMDKEMAYFNQDIQGIQQDTEAMNVTFKRVNRSMSEMRRNVGEISRTANIIPAP
jgi:methyl-accepting chemotaxis protein